MIHCYVDQLSRNSPSGESHGVFNQEKIVGEDYEDVLNQLQDRLGISPPKRPRGVYIDTKSQGAIQVGFISSRWAPCYENHRKSYWEENWVTFAEVDKKPPSLPKFLQSKQ